MSKSEAPGKAGIKIITEHRRAKFDFDLEDTLEAGLELMGSEVKALRDGQANLNDAYGNPEGVQMYLCNAHIGAYKPAAMFAHLPTRKRRLLMHRNEIDKWAAKVRERGYSIVPLMLYFKNGRAKVKLGLGRGKKKGDRRATIKDRETKREMDRAKGF